MSWQHWLSEITSGMPQQYTRVLPAFVYGITISGRQALAFILYSFLGSLFSGIESSPYVWLKPSYAGYSKKVLIAF